MPLKIVRNDIVKMNCDAVVNTANEWPLVGRGCDAAIYNAAGYEKLLQYRKEHIGHVKEGGVFLTPGFDLPARYIIHAVSPAYQDGSHGEEHKLRSCYRKSLDLAAREGFESVAFPLIATGSYQYPKEDGMRIAVDEINAFLLRHTMLVYLVVYDHKATELGKKIYPRLESYIGRHYTGEKEPAVTDRFEESGYAVFDDEAGYKSATLESRGAERPGKPMKTSASPGEPFLNAMPPGKPQKDAGYAQVSGKAQKPLAADFYSGHDSRLAERMEHLSDTFSQYLLYLIQSKGMTNADVYKRAIVDKKVFSKIKNNPNAHPQKMTAMCLCVGAQLNIDEARDLLARAGYALSPSDKTDVIFSYFIENGIYDMIQLDIELEEYGQPCLIT